MVWIARKTMTRPFKKIFLIPNIKLFITLSKKHCNFLIEVLLSNIFCCLRIIKHTYCYFPIIIYWTSNIYFYAWHSFGTNILNWLQIYIQICLLVISHKIIFPLYLQFIFIIPNLFSTGPNRSLTSNFAVMGTFLGHELGHGFDERGFKYNSEGDFDPHWWSEQSKNTFEERKKCFVEQYQEAGSTVRDGKFGKNGKSINSNKI